MTGSLTAAATPFLVAFVTVLALGSWTIERLRDLKMRQSIGTDAPQPEAHQAKKGTPTMGGVLFLFGVVTAIAVGLLGGKLVLGSVNDPLGNCGPLAAIVIVFALHMGLGFLDDYRKATRGKALGLKAREKLTGQVIIAGMFVIYLAAAAQPGLTTELRVWPGVIWDVPPWLYYALTALLMVGLSNSVNITDGLDGLASGLAICAYVGLALSVLSLVPGVAYFGWAMAGACLGFLFYNGNPARVFMGDTGSLPIGASLAAMAILGKQELPLLIFSLVFLIEMASVVIQVVSFKTRGKRVFRMSPIHHHFELVGWKEVQVVQRFWIAGVVALWLGLLAAQALTGY